ncbi:hypothetical protein Tsubulata_019720 [Turnera subulata]|uniref:Thioredoxin domain-containing protein n=1 Tax=Turnera subulata TaxID=218843 RepID=A0A9Q0JN31_9ROSI|nr:hypothetical protein Tsubulata_019720 [Turnera subulata]
MDEVLGKGGRFKTSIADSTMMWILQCAMNKAHERVHSKQGVIARLNEMSKFYELAVMQLEGCLTFVQEEADSSLESSDEETLFDLAEIRDRLRGRLRELELAISEKDRELTQRLENESKLRQAVEHTEREMNSLRANLELEKTKGEGGEEDREEFSELKNSVDQQVWNIKRKLDPDKRIFYKRRSQSFDCIKMEQMSNDINILKETMDLAFGRMHSAIELELKDQQFRWMIEKDAMAILIKGFIRDTKEDFNSEVKRRERQVSARLSKDLSGLMEEIKCLHEELDNLATPQSNLEEKQPKFSVKRSSSLGHNYRLPEDVIPKTDVKTEKTILLGEANPENDRVRRVAMLVKGHESIIRRKNMEVKRKPEVIKEKGFPQCKKEKDPPGFPQCKKEKDPPRYLQRTREVIARLEKLINWNVQLGESLGSDQGENSNEISAAETSFSSPNTTEWAKSQIDSLDAVWEKLSKSPRSHRANEELQSEIRKLKQEKEDANLQAILYEDTYGILLEGLVFDFWSQLNAYDLEIQVRDAMHEHLMKEMTDQCIEKDQFVAIEARNREEIYSLVFGEAVKELGSNLSSASIECQEARERINCLEEKIVEAMERINCLEEKIVEGALREEISIVFFRDVCKHWNEAAETYDVESLVEEKIFSIVTEETIKDTVSLANQTESKYKALQSIENCVCGFPMSSESFQSIESSLQEEVCKVFLKEMFREWKGQIDSFNMECLIREEIYLIVVVEAAKGASNTYGDIQAREHLRISEDFIYASELHRNLESDDESILFQKEESPQKFTAFEDFTEIPSTDVWIHTAHSDKGLKLIELDKPETFRTLLTGMESTAISISSKVGEALKQVAVSKELLSELRCRLGIVDDQMAPIEPVRNLELSLLQPKEDEKLKVTIPESAFKPIMELSQAFVDFERRVEEKLGPNISRLEAAIHYLDPLAEAVASLKRKEWLYRQAFLRRCESLRMAEEEVDLLGDQVEVFQDILEKIFQTLKALLFLFTYFLVFSAITYFTSPSLPPDPYLSSPSVLAKALSFFDQYFYQVNVFNHDHHHHQETITLTLPPARTLLNGRSITRQPNPVDDDDRRTSFVVVLTDDNFTDFVSGNQYVLVDFYAPWCYWSNRLRRHYEAAASLLNGEAVLAKVDATAETGLAKRFHIQGYPTIMMFVNGEGSGVYYDERTGEAIAAWVRQKMNPLPTVKTVEEAERILAAKSFIVVGFLYSFEGADTEELYVASKQHLDIDFYITTDADVARFLHIGDNRPALAVMRKINGKFASSHFSYGGPFTRSTISEFISALKSLPTANPFDDDKMRAEKQVVTGLSDQDKSSWPENAMIGDLPEEPMDIVSSNEKSLRLEKTMMNMFPGDLETSWPDKAIANPVNNHVDSSWRDEPVLVDEEDVVVLTIENFSGFVARNRYVMLNFYAPWCTWSQKLAPEYAAAATILKDEVVLAKIDATKEPELAKLYEIKEYPTVYLLIGGSQKVLYSASEGRTRDAIATWVRSRMNPAVHTVTTTQEAQLLLAHRAVLVMGVLNTLEGPESDVLRAVSEDHMEVNLYRTANVDVARLFQIDPHIRRPALFMMRRESFSGNHCHIPYDGPFTSSDLSDFVSMHKSPLLSPVSKFDYGEESSNQLIRMPLDKPVADKFNDHEKSMMPMDKTVANEFDDHDSFSWSWTVNPVINFFKNHVKRPQPNSQLNNEFDDFLHSSWSDDQPVANALSDHEESLWSNKGETNIVHNDVESSLEDKPQLVDEKDVVVLTRMNISDFLAKNRYVMLVFYAPWCYWSRRLAPAYAAAATLLKDEAVLAKVDCTLEVELAREYEIKAYPTMIFLIGGDQKLHCSDAIVTWIKQKMDVVTQNVETTVEAKRILADKSMMIMAFLDNLEGPDSVEVSAASKLHVDVKFYQTADADVAQSFHIDPEIKRPALVMLKRNAPNGWRIVNFDGPFTRTEISDFVSTYRVPSVITFREEDASRIFDDPLKKLWLFAPRDSWEARNIFEEAAYAFQGKILFIFADVDGFGAQQAYVFGVTDNSPTVLAYNQDDNNLVQRYNGRLTSSGIQSFAKEILEGKFEKQEVTMSKKLSDFYYTALGTRAVEEYLERS